MSVKILNVEQRCDMEEIKNLAFLNLHWKYEYELSSFIYTFQVC